MKDYSNYHTSSKDKIIADGQKVFNFHVSGFEGFDGLVDGIEVKLIIQETTNPLNESKEERKIICLSNVNIQRGSIVVADNITYLVISDVDNNTIIKTAKMLKVYNFINVYKNNTPYQIPCVIQSGIRTSQLGTDENTYIEMPSSTITMRLPNTAITRLIARDEVYQIGLQSWQVKDINDIIEPGLLVMKLEYSQVAQETHVYGVTILNGSSISIQEGSTLQINVQATDNGEIVSSPTLSYSSDDELICTVNSSGLVSALDGGSCAISVSFNGVSDSIEVIVVETVQHNYTYSLSSISTPDTEIKQNQTKTYVTQKYDSGVSVEQTFTFSVVGDSSAYELTVVDGNNCTVKCLKSGYTITLKATDDSDGTKVIEKTIILKALF